jgi:hypothetical protein
MKTIEAAAKACILIFLAVATLTVLSFMNGSNTATAKESGYCETAKRPACMLIIF